MPVRSSCESVSQSSESISGSVDLEGECSWNSHVLAGDTMMFSAPSLESLYIIDSFEERLNDLEASPEQVRESDHVSPKVAQKKQKKSKSYFGSWFGGSSSSQKEHDTTEYGELTLGRRPSCDILLYAAPASAAGCDNFTNAGLTYETNLIAPASEPETSHSVPKISIVGNGMHYGDILTSTFTRDVVITRDDRDHSYGMYLRATRDGRVLCTGVDPESLAAQAGIEMGDELLIVNGYFVRGYDAPRQLLSKSIVYGFTSQIFLCLWL